MVGVRVGTNIYAKVFPVEAMKEKSREGLTWILVRIAEKQAKIFKATRATALKNVLHRAHRS